MNGALLDPRFGNIDLLGDTFDTPFWWHRLKQEVLHVLPLQSPLKNLIRRFHLEAMDPSILEPLLDGFKKNSRLDSNDLEQTDDIPWIHSPLEKLSSYCMSKKWFHISQANAIVLYERGFYRFSNPFHKTWKIFKKCRFPILKLVQYVQAF